MTSTPSDQMTSASCRSSVHSRNIRMLESKPTSMPPSPLSRTIGNFAMTTISGMLSGSSPDMATPSADHVDQWPRKPAAKPSGEHAEVEPAAARGGQRSQASGHGSSGSWVGTAPVSATAGAVGGFDPEAGGGAWRRAARRRGGTRGPAGSRRATRGGRRRPARTCAGRGCAAWGCSTAATRWRGPGSPGRSRWAAWLLTVAVVGRDVRGAPGIERRRTTTGEAVRRRSRSEPRRGRLDSLDEILARSPARIQHCVRSD